MAPVAEVVGWVILPAEMMTAAPETTAVGAAAAVAAVRILQEVVPVELQLLSPRVDTSVNALVGAS